MSQPYARIVPGALPLRPVAAYLAYATHHGRAKTPSGRQAQSLTTTYIAPAQKAHIGRTATRPRVRALCAAGSARSHSCLE